MICIIAAVAANGAIGYRNRLLFDIREDMTRFRELTWGHTVVMGRHTFESLPNGPLPGRRNIVVSTTMEQAVGAEVFGALAMAMEACRTDDMVFVIGGEQIYRQAISMADRLYITEIESTAEHADSWFPAYGGWKLTDKKQRQGYAFCIYER